MLQGSISSFSSFYFSSSNIILPVKLLTFTGTLQNKITVLKWETVNEFNASNFVIERSVDGVLFNSIGTVTANNITGTNNYLFNDVNAADQMVPVLYYRLRMVDIDGSYTYSKVISVSFTSLFPVYEYPNPVQDVLNLKISLAKSDNLLIQITDIQGKTYYNKTKLVNNNTDVQIDCRRWPSQLYLIKVTASNGDIISTEKVLKL
jgi:hypothetical protein